MPITVFEARYIDRLMYNCIRGNESYCARLDLFRAVTLFRGMVDDVLTRDGLRLPDELRGLHSEVDPDGAPGRPAPEEERVIVRSDDLAKNATRARGRLQIATELRRGIVEIGEVLDRDIEALQRVAK